MLVDGSFRPASSMLVLAQDVKSPSSSIIQALLSAREEAGISQSRLSELTGITQPDISRIEKGKANPSVRTLKRLAAGLGKRLVIGFI